MDAAVGVLERTDTAASTLGPALCALITYFTVSLMWLVPINLTWPNFAEETWAWVAFIWGTGAAPLLAVLGQER